MKTFFVLGLGAVVCVCVGGVAGYFLYPVVEDAKDKTEMARLQKDNENLKKVPPTAAPASVKDALPILKKLEAPKVVKWQTKSKKLVVEDTAPEGFALQVTSSDGKVIGVAWEKRPMALPAPFDVKPAAVNWYWRCPETLTVLQSSRQESIVDEDK